MQDICRRATAHTDTPIPTDRLTGRQRDTDGWTERNTSVKHRFFVGLEILEQECVIDLNPYFKWYSQASIRSLNIGVKHLETFEGLKSRLESGIFPNSIILSYITGTASFH